MWQTPVDLSFLLVYFKRCITGLNHNCGDYVNSNFRLNLVNCRSLIGSSLIDLKNAHLLASNCNAK